MKATCVFISELDSAEERDKFQAGAATWAGGDGRGPQRGERRSQPSARTALPSTAPRRHAPPATQAILPALLACIGRALNEGDESAAQVGGRGACGLALGPSYPIALGGSRQRWPELVVPHARASRRVHTHARSQCQ